MNKKTVRLNEADLMKMIKESTKKYLNEEEELENNNDGTEGVDFLSRLEGYHQALKMMHWSTDNHSKHLLTDDIDKSILEFEDEVAENLMGITGTKISEGLKGDKPDVKDLKELLSSLEQDVLGFINEYEGERSNRGLINICDDFLSEVNKYKYLETLS